MAEELQESILISEEANREIESIGREACDEIRRIAKEECIAIRHAALRNLILIGTCLVVAVSVLLSSGCNKTAAALMSRETTEVIRFAPRAVVKSTRSRAAVNPHSIVEGIEP